MTGREFANIRKASGLSRVEMAIALGYAGSQDNLYRLMRKYEARARVPPGLIVRVGEWARKENKGASLR